MISSTKILGLWIAGLLLLLVGLGNPPVTRTQEARVLETARQMMGSGTSGWINPMLNGEPRIKKPPLCYWMTAAAYSIGGVSEGVGRLPTAVLGWMTLGILYLIACRLFDQRTALIACGLLLGNIFFYRYTRLAETDAPVMCFLTLAAYLILRSTTSNSLLWPHLLAVSVAMIVMAKGAPAIFVAILLISYAAVEHRWDILKRFILSGAPLTLILLAVPWFYFAEDAAGSELRNTLVGGDHFDWPWRYFFELFPAAAPWSAIWPIAMFHAVRRWKVDSSTRFALLWFLSILVPLCINGNKQNHYLIMLMPPLMLLIGGLLARIPAELEKLIKGLLTATAIALAVGAIAGPPAMVMIRGQWLPIDAIAALMLLAAATFSFQQLRKNTSNGIPAMVMAAAVLMPVLLGYWIPSADVTTDREIAASITHSVGKPPFVFYGRGADLQLCFYLKRAIPFASDTHELMRTSTPGSFVMVTTRGGLKTPELPANFQFQDKFVDGESVLALYKHTMASSITPATNPASHAMPASILQSPPSNPPFPIDSLPTSKAPTDPLE